MRRQSLTFYKRFWFNCGGHNKHSVKKAIGIEPEVHPITDIEASLLLIAHSKQYQACRQVLSICILSAHRSTHVLISRCRSMATDLEIICLSSKQDYKQKRMLFSTAFKMHAKHIQNAVCLKKTHELSCMCFKYVR